MGQAITHTPAPAPADTALYIGNSRHSCTGHQVIFMGKGADLHYLKSLKAKQMLNAYYSQSHTHTPHHDILLNHFTDRFCEEDII